MGTGYNIKCNSCGFEKEVFFGIGMMYYELDKILDILPAKYKKEVLSIKEFGNINDRDYYRAVYVCDTCKNLYNRLYVKILYDSEKIFQTEYTCRRCRKPLRELDEHVDFTNLFCPKCGKKDLETNVIIMWD